MFYLTHYNKNIISMCNQYKIINLRYLTLCFGLMFWNPVSILHLSRPYFKSSVTLVSFQVLSDHMWLMATGLDSAGIEIKVVSSVARVTAY